MSLAFLLAAHAPQVSASLCLVFWGIYLYNLSTRFQVAQVICGYRVNVELESTAVYHFPLALVPANLVYIGKVMLTAVRCQYGLVNIVLDLVTLFVPPWGDTGGGIPQSMTVATCRPPR